MNQTPAEKWAQVKTDALIRKALLDLSAQFLALAVAVVK